MKINVLMKIAVVFMAAFGAYAFSGSNLNSQQYKTFDESLQICTNLVTAECTEFGNNECRINFNGKVMPLFDLGCTEAIKHNSNELVIWN